MDLAEVSALDDAALNLAVAEHVMWPDRWPHFPDGRPATPAGPWTEDMTGAWRVVESMHQRLFSARAAFLVALQRQTQQPDGRVVAWPDVLWYVTPRAICRAAVYVCTTYPSSATVHREREGEPTGLLEKVRVPEGRCGDWEVERFTVDERGSLESLFSHGASRACAAGTYTRLVHRGQVIMSDTPAEMRDHRAPVYRARGSVLINGLGLGLVLQGVLAQPEVEDVTVVEIAPEVIRLVGPTYDDPRVTIVCADAYTWKPPKGKRYNVVWHDIWSELSVANLPLQTKLHRKYGRRCDWQGSWGRDFLRAEGIIPR